MRFLEAVCAQCALCCTLCTVGGPLLQTPFPQTDGMEGNTALAAVSTVKVAESVRDGCAGGRRNNAVPVSAATAAAFVLLLAALALQA